MVKEVVKIDRELLEMVHSIRFSRFFRPKSRDDCFHASESTKMAASVTVRAERALWHSMLADLMIVVPNGTVPRFSDAAAADAAYGRASANAARLMAAAVYWPAMPCSARRLCVCSSSVHSTRDHEQPSAPCGFGTGRMRSKMSSTQVVICMQESTCVPWGAPG